MCSSDLFSAVPTLTKDGKSADPRKMFALMGLGIKCGDTITLSFDGEDESAAAEALAVFLKENL